MRSTLSGLAQWVLAVVLVLGVGGCAGLGSVLRDTPDLAGPAAQPPAEAVSFPSSVTDGPGHPASESATPDQDPPTRSEADGTPVQLALGGASSAPADGEIEEYDPWEPFNEKMFEFNRQLDRWIVKPAAKGYNRVMPERLQEMISNGFDNIRVVPRFVNSLLQGKLAGAGRELTRFLINSTIGVGGLFDVAKREFNIDKSKEDGGQTLGVWGLTPGPYLVLPFLPPLTVRDGVGYAFDMALDPLGYVLPFFWDRAGMKVGDTVNDRSLNMDLYQGFEEATVELYSALRNAYLQRRLKLIQE